MNIYGFLIGLGVVIIMFSVDRVFKDKIKLTDYIISCIITLCFARLAYIIHHTPLLLNDWTLFFKVYQGGVSILGAIVGMTISVLIFSKKRKINFLKFSDTVFLNLPIVQAIGRLGNFFNQEVYGYPTDLPWGIYIEKAKRVPGYTEFEKFHPIFAYELIFNIFNWLFLLYIYKKYNLKKGLITTLFFLNYGIIRIIVNRFRLEKGYILDIETADFFSSLLIFIGALLIIHMIGSKNLQKNIAKVISKILNPFLIASIPFFIIAFQKNLFKIEPLHITAIILIGIIGPIIQFKVFKKLKLVNDWDISDRTKRPLFTGIAGTLFLMLFFISLLSISTELKILTLALTITTYIFALISMFWKISGHLTFLSLTIASLYLITKSPVFLYLYLPLLILVSWSRVKLKQHDILQTVAGSLLGLLIIAFIWFLVNTPLSF